MAEPSAVATTTIGAGAAALPECRYSIEKGKLVRDVSLVIPTDDLAHFAPLLNEAGGCTSYAEDSHNVYYLDEAVKGANVDSFIVLGSSKFFSKDSSSVFYRGTKISAADPLTFTPLYDVNGRETLYSNDQQHVFASDPQSTHTIIIGSLIAGYGSDDWNQYYGQTRRPIMDTAN